MTNILDLIHERYPNGVEHKTVGEIAKLSRGEVINKLYIEQNPGPYPVYSSQTTNNGELGRISTYDYDGEYLTWTTDGYAGRVFYRNEKFNITNVCGLIEVNPDIVLAKYLYYALQKIAPDYVNTNRATRNTLMRKDMEIIPIPIPPLEVQQIIVDVLDRYELAKNNIVAALTKETELRKKQYNYYRNHLLRYNPNPTHNGLKPYELGDELSRCNNTITKSLGELGKFYGGLTGKTKMDFIDVNAKYITYKNVYNNTAVDLSATDMVEIKEGEHQHALQLGDIIFTGSSETPNECGMSSVVIEQPTEPIYLNSFCFFLRLHDPNILYPNYCRHLFRTQNLRDQITKASQGVIRYNLSRRKMESIVIPLPPLDIQKQIADVLDKFEHYTNEITGLLPKEIELRKKQYKYYRDLLLDFKASANVESPSP